MESNEAIFCNCEIKGSSFQLDNGTICCCKCEKEIKKMKDGREELIHKLQMELEMNKAITGDFVDEMQKYAIWFLEWYDKSGYVIDAYASGTHKKMTSITLWNEFLNDIYNP